MQHDARKSQGIHYTPPELACFLARVTAAQVRSARDAIEVVDPACGSGSLLEAFYLAMPTHARARLVLVGFDREKQAVQEARRALAGCEAHRVELYHADFVALEGVQSPPAYGRHRPLAEQPLSVSPRRFDVVIANPPYVRTQILGARRSQALARRFGLTGRIDLYQVFAKAMASVLKPDGVLGLLTSNRFLTVRSGASLRRLLGTEFQLRHVYDLGDTKLFGAAVLPAVLVARRRSPSPRSTCGFDRVYEHRNGSKPAEADHHCDSILSAMLEARIEGNVRTPTGLYTIERGRLLPHGNGGIWSLSTPEHDAWRRTIAEKQAHPFGDLGVIRVGIKTCADSVFIRQDWECLPAGRQPEPCLVRPLITHSIAAPWRPTEPPGATRVLYPHVIQKGKRRAIALADYPRAAEYLRSHYDRLTRRTYVTEAGRQWYEIWVPHHPQHWSRPKMVFPDISELPKFFFDRSGAIVNGDCYWITLRPGIEEDWLLLMLAVANSSFITKYYDVVFHNKLYAGRRRFMTQYVKEFPVPELDSRIGKRIVRLAAGLVDGFAAPDDVPEVDALVWEAFGLHKEP